MKLVLFALLIYQNGKKLCELIVSKEGQIN